MVEKLSMKLYIKEFYNDGYSIEPLSSGRFRIKYRNLYYKGIYANCAHWSKTGVFMSMERAKEIIELIIPMLNMVTT